jgi:large subunit ribosomal protein L34
MLQLWLFIGRGFSLGGGHRLMKKNLKTPSNRVGKRRHGFRRKMASKAGRRLLQRRRRKGRKRISR